MSPSRRPRLALRLAPALVVVALAAASPAACSERYWVFFRDKGHRSAGELARALRQLAVAGWPGLEREGRPPVEFADLPVHDPYVDELRRLGFRVRHTSRWLNAASVEAPAGDVLRLAGLPHVRAVRLTARTERSAPPLPEEASATAPSASGVSILAASPVTPDEFWFYGRSLLQNLQIGIVELHRRGYTGSGVTIAMLDTGFRLDHPCLLPLEIVAERDFVHRDDTVYDPAVDTPAFWEHGTGTMSNAGGFAPGHLVGGAYGARYLVARTEDERGEYPREEDNYIAALEWADSLGADVVSASLAYFQFDGDVGYGRGDLDGDTIPLTVAVDMAVRRGMAVVNSAANQGPGATTIWSPADADSVISVGAVDSLGVLTPWSSRGPTADGRIKPEVVARGLFNLAADSRNQGYRSYSGTSFSGPMIAGLVALLKEAHPDWDGARLREALISTAAEARTPTNERGYGLALGMDACDLEPAEAPVLPGPFSLLGPVQGAVLNPDEPIRLTWSPARPGRDERPVRYVVELSTTQDGAPAIRRDAGLATSIAIDPGDLASHEAWYWTVRVADLPGPGRSALRGSSFRLVPTVPPERGWPVVRHEVRGVGPSLNVGTGTTPGTLIVHWAVPVQDGAAGTPRIRLDVFDARGRRVACLLDSRTRLGGSAGGLAWDGRDDAGRLLPSSVYFLVLTSPHGTVTARGALAR
jgi:hypothetical protein